MKIQDKTVYGERIGDLMPLLAALRDGGSIDDDGMFHSSITFEPTVGHPLIRAMMRAEAELLLEDADAIGTESAATRTHEQRCADALVQLAKAIAAA